MQMLWLRYRIGPFLTIVGQVLPLVVLVGMLVWVVNFYTLQTNFRGGEPGPHTSSPAAASDQLGAHRLSAHPGQRDCGYG